MARQRGPALVEERLALTEHAVAASGVCEKTHSVGILTAYVQGIMMPTCARL
jgi:hypothetical protein